MESTPAHEAPQAHPYVGRKIVLTTKHGKLPLIAPILEAELGVQVVLHEADTDQLGTFTGEVERTLSPQEAAIAKAKLGVVALDLDLGIASEGSIGSDPLAPFIQSDIEYIALVDLSRGIEVVERYRSLQIIAGEIATTAGSDLSDFLRKVDFPNHKLIVRPNDKSGEKPIKGISTLEELEQAIDSLSGKSKDGKALVQSDLRAHCSPSRQQNIVQATQLLVKRIQTPCPSCASPGFGFVRFERGLDCSACGELVKSAPKFEVFGCVNCPIEQAGSQLAELADPSSCEGCNP